MKQRVLVCGGRDYADKDLLYTILDTAHAANPIVTLIVGDASGADALAAEWAKDRDIPLEEYPAAWERHGRAAGPIRNKQMLDEGRPHLVIAFPGGRGTANMVAQAETADVPVAKVKKLRRKD